MPSRLGSTVNYSGLIVAGTGFFLTRFTVTLAIYEDPTRFYFAGVVPLLLGLGLAAFGVALTVADVDPAVVRTTAGWCLGGVLAMAVLVVLTVLGSNGGTALTLEPFRAQNYYSNFLIGGSIGGTLTGLYASRNRRQRLALERQANRLDVLNRLLRHEVLNSVTLIKGYAGQIGDDDETVARDVIESRSRSIQEVIENVKFLANGSADTDGTASTVDLDQQLARSVDDIQDRYPEADVHVDAPPGDCTVRATTGLGQVFVQLLENAIVHGRDHSPTVSVTETSRHVRVSVRNEGTEFPETQRSLLETGEIEPFDDPGSGFGLNLVRLFVDDFGGTIETDVGPSETTITIELLRAGPDDAGFRPMPTGVADVRPALPHLVVTLLAAIVAGVVYGAVSEVLGGSIAGIGVFYGTENFVVGWLTHEFHSVVFGFVFAGLVSIAPRRYRGRMGGHVLIGLGWAVVLWAVAAGVVAPVWLRLLGIPAQVPTLTLDHLATHLVWGLSLGVLTAVGYRFVAARRSEHAP
jgi:signal transduction histidine kinase